MPRTNLFASLYFGAQAAYGGVSQEMIWEASRLLDSRWSSIEDHALRRLKAIHGPQVTWEWLTRRAPVDRLEMHTAAQHAVADPFRERRIQVRRTSGSTGAPFVFPRDREMTAQMDAAMWAAYGWHGVKPGQPHARFWGAPPTFPKRLKVAVRDLLLHRYRVSAFKLTGEDARRHFTWIRRLKPVYAYGYPSLLREFAQLASDQNLPGPALGFRLVITTGELLTANTRREIEGYFGCRVVNEYGCTESGVLGFECEQGTMHTIPTAAWPETLPLSRDHRPAATQTEVVVTDLYGSVMPLLRYRLGDHGVQAASTCQCGRDLPELKVESGRTDSFIQTPRGPVYDAILAYTVPHGVQRFRVYQVARDRLEAMVVVGAGFSASGLRTECRRAWERAVGPGMTVTVDIVPDLPLEPSGKLRYFVPLHVERT